MYFLFVLVIYLLSLPTLFKDKCCALEEDIYNTYKHSEIINQQLYMN